MFIPSVMSSSLRPHGLRDAGFPCLSLSPRVCLNSCPLNWWSWQSNPLLPSFPFAFNLSQYQGLFQWVSSSHQVAKVLVLQLQHQSFQWIIQGWFPLGLTGWISLKPTGLSRVFSSTTVWKLQLFSSQPSLWSNSHIPTSLLEKSYLLSFSFEFFLKCFTYSSPKKFVNS